MKEFKRTKNNPTIGMTNEEVTEYWINRSIDKYGDNFSYANVGIISTKKDVIKIYCKNHGLVETTFNNHIASGTGCYKCGDEVCRNGKRMTFEEFLSRVDRVFPDKNFKILSKHFSSRQIKHSKVYVQDEFGICKIAPTVLLKGTPPSITNACFPNLYTTNKYHKVHGYNTLDFSYSEYKTALSYTEVNCRKHGIFSTKPNWLLNGQGCGKCYEDRRGATLKSNTKDFIKKSMNRWGHNMKIYDRVNYVGAKDKILILCERHDMYYPITPNDHLTGYGCPICGLETGGYSRESYVNRAQNKDNLVYLIRCWDEYEEFYKIGRTYKGVKKRFDRQDSMPYNYEIIYEYRCGAECVYDTEISLHYENREFKYTPKIYFAGYIECFNLSLPIQEIINNLKTI